MQFFVVDGKSVTKNDEISLHHNIISWLHHFFKLKAADDKLYPWERCETVRPWRNESMAKLGLLCVCDKSWEERVLTYCVVLCSAVYVYLRMYCEMWKTETSAGWEGEATTSLRCPGFFLRQGARGSRKMPPHDCRVSYKQVCAVENNSDHGS